jgi:hypothetical protein
MGYKIILKVKNLEEIDLKIVEAPLDPNYPDHKKVFDDFTNRLMEFCQKESIVLTKQMDKIWKARQNPQKEDKS